MIYSDCLIYLSKKDAVLRRIIKELPPLTFKKKRGGFDAIVKIITGQQLSGKAAESIFNRLRALNNGKPLTPEFVDRIADTTLREAGLSTAKIIAVRALIEKIASKELRIYRFSKMTDEEITEAITQVKGLGPWSAQMYLMFVLHRPDVFPINDLGIKRSVQRLYEVEATVDELIALSDKWRPHRTTAAWYLWHSLANRP
ncbi:MAG: DNA-3-methyladenine glycosylase 2 family protein [candidate division Zixibacteria bacterium]|nr:DNA-3-methyladenine glycosylase 2 family protein [candidate division Zixibacteria bacterium]